MAASEALRKALLEGLVIPAHPLALTAERTLDERRQIALTRYYAEAGAGGIAVGVHSTQFAIRKAGLFEPVLSLAAETAAESERLRGRALVKIAGAIGPTAQAVGEAEHGLPPGLRRRAAEPRGARATRARESSSITAGASPRCCRSSASTSSPPSADGRSTRASGGASSRSRTSWP